MGHAVEELAWGLCRPRKELALAPTLVGSGAPVLCSHCWAWLPSDAGLWQGGEGDRSGRWLCADCLLAQEAGANPFEALDTPAERWFALAALFQQRPLPSATLPVDSKAPDASGPGYFAFTGQLAIFWDGLDRAAFGVANSLAHAFPGLCFLVNTRDARELEQGLARWPAVPREVVCRRGGVSGVLPPGIFITDCEKYPQMLLYELKYRRTVRPPAPEVFHSYEREFLAPLARIRAAFDPGTDPHGLRWWWNCDEALSLVVRSLVKHKFCLLDDFLPERDYRELADSIRQFHCDGRLTPGTLYYKLRQKHNKEEGGPDLLSNQAQPRKWNMRTESLIYCNDDDACAPALAHLGRASDAVIVQLKEGGPERDPECARRLHYTDFREPHLCACYPGGFRGRHARHVDNDSEWLHRTITAIIYFNDIWGRENGGEFRLFTEERNSTDAAFDVLPIRNRMIFFWATEDCPHEVLHCNRDRFAISLIYVDGRASLRDPSGQGRARVLQELIPTVPMTRDEALRKSAGSEREARELTAQAQALRGLAVQAAATGEPQRCAQCGAVSSEGAVGGEGYSAWYCRACWRLWEEPRRPDQEARARR